MIIMKNKRLWGYDDAGEPMLGEGLSATPPTSKSKKRIFAKVLWEYQGRLRVALENPPVGSYDQLSDDQLIDTADVAQWRGTTIATVCNHVKAGFIKSYRPKSGTIRGNYFRVREVRRWISSVPIGRWPKKKTSKK